MFWWWVGVRVVVNPLSNVFQKRLTGRGISPLIIVAVTHALLSLACLPVFIAQGLPIGRGFWVNITLCAALAVAGNSLIVKAVQLSDLSLLGPVNAYKAVISLVPGIVLLGEVPSLPALCGVALIVAGSCVMADPARDTTGERVSGPLFADRGVQCRLAALVFSGVEAVFLKRALADSTPLTVFAVWAVLCLLLAVPLAARFENIADGLSRSLQFRRHYLLLAATTGLMQLGTLIVFDGFQVAPALALFQTSSLVSVLLGWRMFGEKNIARRLAGSVLMAAGAVLIVATRAA